jgi:general secretion pathway protein D
LLSRLSSIDGRTTHGARRFFPKQARLRRALQTRALGLLLCAPIALHAQTHAAASAAPAAQPPHAGLKQQAKAQKAFEQGGRAIQRDHLDEAVTAFAEAVKLDPANQDYDAALAITKDNYATQLMQRALKERLQGHAAAFHELVEQAIEQDKQNPLVVQHESEIADSVDTGQRATVGPVVEAGPPVQLAPARRTLSFHLYLPPAETIRQVMEAYGITPTLDASVTGPDAGSSLHFDADDVSFAQAEKLLELGTDTFVVPLDPKRAIVALDTQVNRDKLQRISLETVSIPTFDPNAVSEISDMARNVFKIDKIVLDDTNNTLTLRAPEAQLKAFNAEVNELLEGHSETLLDIDIYEVQRSRMTNEGVTLPQSTTIFNVGSEVNSLLAANPSLVQQIIASGLADPGNLEEIALALILSGQAGSTILSQPFAVFGGGITLSGLTLAQSAGNMLLNVSDTRVIDRTQLYLTDREEGNVTVGESYPIVTSSYSNLATGSTSIPGITSAGLSSTLQNLGINLSALTSAASATVPQVQYQDIGLLLNATPSVHGDRDVSLKLRFELSSLSGQSLNGNPVLNDRKVDSIIQVKPGERTVLVSLLSNQEDHELIGFPFLSEIPGFTFATNREVNHTQDSLVIIITPRILHLAHVHERGKLVMLPVRFGAISTP